MEQYKRYFNYIEQANKLVYDYYSVHGFGSICHYFNINWSQSTADMDKLRDGSYEVYGDMSGIRFTKILLLPVYFVDPIQPSYIGDERGYIHETESSIVIPSTYGLTPYEHDIVYFPTELNPSVKYPIYEVIGIEKATDTPVTFYRCRIRSARTSYDVVNNQVVELKIWFEPLKKIVDHKRGLFLYENYQAMLTRLDQLEDSIHHATGTFVI